MTPRRRRAPRPAAAPAVRTVRQPAAGPAPTKSLVGRGEPAARRARARRSAEQTLAARHGEELAGLLAAAAAARRGPASARTELMDTHAEEYATLLQEAEGAEGLSGFQSGYTPGSPATATPPAQAAAGETAALGDSPPDQPEPDSWEAVANAARDVAGDAVGAAGADAV